MKYLLKIFLRLTIFFFPLACFAEIPADIQKIIARGKLIVAINRNDYPPFYFHGKNNELEGYDIDIVKDMAKALNVQLMFNSQANSFNDVIGEVENDRADIGIGSLSATVQRGLQVSFSKPYLKERKSMIVNRVLDLKLEQDESQVDPKLLRFGVIKNSAYESFLKEKFYIISKYANPSRIVAYDNLKEAMGDLMEGKIYAILLNEIEANFQLKSLKSANIYAKKRNLEGQIDPISIAVSYKNPNLLEWVNLFAQNLEDGGSQQFLAQKYLKGLNNE